MQLDLAHPGSFPAGEGAGVGSGEGQGAAWRRGVPLLGQEVGQPTSKIYLSVKIKSSKKKTSVCVFYFALQNKEPPNACTIMYCTVLYCTVLYCTVLYFFYEIIHIITSFP